MISSTRRRKTRDQRDRRPPHMLGDQEKSVTGAAPGARAVPPEQEQGRYRACPVPKPSLHAGELELAGAVTGHEVRGRDLLPGRHLRSTHLDRVRAAAVEIAALR